MRTIKKSEIVLIDLVPSSHHEITESGKDYVYAKGINGLMIRVDTSIEQNMYEVIDNKIWQAPHILINNEISVIYDNDSSALVSYTKSVEQLNNPNIEYISF